MRAEFITCVREHTSTAYEVFANTIPIADCKKHKENRFCYKRHYLNTVTSQIQWHITAVRLMESVDSAKINGIHLTHVTAQCCVI